MRRLLCLYVLIILFFLTIWQGCGETGSLSGISEEKGFESFSFAIITDVHVGRGFSDYGAEGWADYNLNTGQANDGNEGGFNYVTDRLTATVNWLNENYQKENIKFLVILGDISDTAEMSEFFRAKKILDSLEIPYIPLMGNHDYWAYVNETSTLDRVPIGDFYFENIFWNEFHNRNNIKKIKSLFKDTWKKQEKTKPGYLQNYAFSYQGINFIALDYARRDLNLAASLAEPFQETKEWLEDNLGGHQRETGIVFSHYPYMVRGGFEPWEADYLAEAASQNEVSVLNFGGHIHYSNNVNETFGKDSKAPVIVTKGLMGGESNLQEKEDPDFLRIVRVKGLKIEDVDYSNEGFVSGGTGIVTISTGTPTPTPTAVQTATATIACPSEGKPKFAISQEVITTDALKVRENPGLAALEIRNQPKGTSGKILEGPVCADNYIWWKVEYQDGAVGWSAQDWLGVKESQFQRSYLCDFSQPVPLRETTQYGIFGNDNFDTIVCGYLKSKEIPFPVEHYNAYLVISDFLHEGLIRSIDKEIRIGNSVNIKEGNDYWFNLGCLKDGEIISGADINTQTQQAILDSSPSKPVSLVLSFEKHPGYDCDCCNLANKISLYPPISPIIPEVDAQKAKENALSHAIETNSRGDMLLINNPEYQIIYFAKEDQFLISIQKSPFEEWRQKAEEEFLQITKAEKRIACQLNVVVSTPQFANPEESGKIFPPSFCLVP